MVSSFKQQMEHIAGEKAPGPSTTFSAFHIFYALELMAEKPIGRNRLAEKLNVGDGAIRTIINHLRGEGLIVAAKEGCSLTEKGTQVWERFEALFPQRGEVARTELTNAVHNYGFLVKGSGGKVKSGIEQRDAAIIAGAKRATVIVSRKGGLCIQSVSDDIAKDFPKAAELILKNFKPEDNDVLVVAGADSVLRAKQGAFAAAWSLVDEAGKT